MAQIWEGSDVVKSGVSVVEGDVDLFLDDTTTVARRRLYKPVQHQGLQ